MAEYTDASSIQSELQTTVAFSSSTIPSLTDITSWIEEESELINQEAGRKFGSTQYTEVIDYDGSDLIQVRHTPIISVNSILYSTAQLDSTSYALSDTQVEGTDFTVYKDRGEIRPLFNSWTPKIGEKRIQITYTAGYATTPTLIKMLATKRVALRTLNTLLSKNMSEGNDGGSISVGSINIVEPADYGTGRYGTLQSDVKELSMKIVGGTSAYRYSGINWY